MTTKIECASIDDLASEAHEQPIVADISDLAGRILEKAYGLEVIDSIEEFYWRAESVDQPFDRDVVIQDTTSELPDLTNTAVEYTVPEGDLQFVDFTGSAYSPVLNSLVENELSWQDIKETTLSQSAVADRVVQHSSDVDLVAVVVVDGLSYHDWTRFIGPTTPVYVDCPTITQCGYPNVVNGGENGTSLATRLGTKRDIKARRAFTYWEKEQTEITEKLHVAFSPNDVVGDVHDFSDVVTYLDDFPFDEQSPIYIQITLTGPERVAHKIKEHPDVRNQVQLVHDKITNLGSLLQDAVDSYYLALTADHGMIWRMDNELVEIEQNINRKKRRSIENPGREVSLPESIGQDETWEDSRYLRLFYPYLFGSLKQNEPGTHGGYSYQESLVPLVEYKR